MEKKTKMEKKKVLVLSVFAFLSLGAHSQPYEEKNGIKLYRSLIQGQPTGDDIRKDFMKGMKQYRSCHQDNIERGGKAMGKVEMRFFLGKNGKAYNAQVLGDVPKTMKDCLIASLASLQFYGYTEGNDIEVKQPISFKAVELTGTKEKE